MSSDKTKDNDNKPSQRNGTETSPRSVRHSRPSRISRPNSLQIEDPPRSPRLIPVTPIPLREDTEANVVSQTECIIDCFMFERHVLDHRDEVEHVEYDARHAELCGVLKSRTPTPLGACGGQPTFPQTNDLTPPIAKVSEDIGRQLAEIADDINHRYENEFRRMVGMLNFTELNYNDAYNFAYESFANIARSLFQDGKISWGRIVSLLSFGYHLAVGVFSKNIGSFFKRIVTYLVKFIAAEKIAQWIAAQGGWVAILCFNSESTSYAAMGSIILSAVVILGITYYFNNGK